MKTYLQLSAAEKRQTVLDTLWRAVEITGTGLPFAEIRDRLGANQSLSSTLNSMMERGEIKHGRRITGNQIEWLPLVDTTAPTRLGPAPVDKTPAPEHEPHVRVVRLLNKPNTSRGGQGAIQARPGIQSGMQMTMEAA